MQKHQSLVSILALGAVGALSGCGSQVDSSPELGSTEAAVNAVTQDTETVSLSVDEDTSILPSAKNTNFGGASSLEVDRAVVQVSPAALENALGPADYVVSATLSFDLVNPGQPVRRPREVTLHRLLVDWTESAATFKCAIDSNTSNATKNCSGPTAWTMKGDSSGTFVSAPTDTSSVPTSLSGSVAFDVTSDVHAFLSGTVQNFGWMTQGKVPEDLVDFGSREGGAPARLLLEIQRCSESLCDDGNACTADSCAADGSCVNSAVADGGDCSDGNACTTGDSCIAGECNAGLPVVCPQTDGCHPASCEPETGSCSEVSACQFYGLGEISATDLDGLDLDPVILEEGSPNNRVSAFGSAIAYSGEGDLFVATPDRGPADGATSYTDRYYLIDLGISGGSVTPSIVGAATLNKAPGVPFRGTATAFDPTNSTESLRFDPEGVRVGPNGAIYVSDEYGPFLYEFSASGDRVRALDVPSKFLISNPGVGNAELPPANTSGRQSNRGMEGLAISPDGQKLYGIMQNSLIQDGALNQNNTRVGLNTRILEVDTGTGATRELLYQLDNAAYGISEIVAVSDSEFLVLERDGRAGAAALFKRLILIDIDGATDISDIASLPTSGTPDGVTPVSKRPFLDMLSPEFGLAGAAFPEKMEGVAFGQDVDGKHVLVITSDNDGIIANSNKFFVFTVDPLALPGFVAESAAFPSGCEGVACSAADECHRDGVCNPGTLECSEPLEAVGSTCSGGSCDEAGECVACLAASDCPGEDGPCAARSCTEGVCGVDVAPEGTSCGENAACDGLGTCVFAQPPVSVVINEVESSGGVPGDWIELYNADATAADVTGFVVKDNDDTHNYALPVGSVIPGFGYLVVNEAQLGFGLGSIDSARLFYPDVVTLVDSYSWTAHASTSYGRCPNGTGDFTTTTAVTKGGANGCPDCVVATDCSGEDTACAFRTCTAGACGVGFGDEGTECGQNASCDGAGICLAEAIDVVINEVESNGGVPGDWVELYNAGAEPVDLSGFVFKDNDNTHNYALPPGTILAAGAYLVLEEGQFGFGLGSADSARLFYPDVTTVVDSHSWTAHASTTYGRCPNGDGPFVTMSSVTKGAPNSCQ